MSILVQLPNTASTFKYPKTFPQPLNLLALYQNGDELIDLALLSFRKKRQEVLTLLDQYAQEINEVPVEATIYVNAGDFPADASYDEYFDYFFSKLTRKVFVLGTYPIICWEDFHTKYPEHLLYQSKPMFSRYDVLDLEQYPKVGNKTRASIRASWGCPRHCKMCPVPLYFNSKFTFFSIESTVSTIRYLYNEKNVRYITFIDDNLSISAQFIDLLKELKQLDLKGLEFHCQEGFDVEAFTSELAQLLVDLHFDDIKIAFESIVPHTIEAIDKKHLTKENIDKVLEIIHEHNLKVKSFLLLGIDETEEEALENIKFFTKHGLTMRVNIVRNYGNFDVKPKISDKRLRELKALAYAASFWTESFGANIFEPDSTEQDALTLAHCDYDGEDTITGKTRYGFQTSRFEKGIEFMFERRVLENSGDRIVLGPERDLTADVHEGDDTRNKGFSAEALKQSREIRAAFLSRFGIDGKVPTSILKHDRKESKYDTIDTALASKGGGYMHHYRKNIYKMQCQDDYTPGIEESGLMTQGRTGYLSSFPTNVGRIITDLYCPDNGTVYDPFAGHNSRMQMVFRLKRNYIGVDVSHEFMEHNRAIRDILYERRRKSLNIQKSDNWIKLYEYSSSMVIDVADESADFSITSPPYWNLEYYGDEPEQLGNARTYEDFIILLGAHVRENFRILKPGSFCAWNINDFRKNKVFYPYHMDVYRIMVEAGFMPFSVLIIDLGQTVNHMFVRDLINHRLLPKQHEYIILMRKPGPDWWEKTE